MCTVHAFSSTEDTARRAYPEFGWAPGERVKVNPARMGLNDLGQGSTLWGARTSRGRDRESVSARGGTMLAMELALLFYGSLCWQRCTHAGAVQKKSKREK